MEQGRGTQVVRERSAKPLCVGSIPTRASKFYLLSSGHCAQSMRSSIPLPDIQITCVRLEHDLTHRIGSTRVNKGYAGKIV